jgi:hypothetical protein
MLPAGYRLRGYALAFSIASITYSIGFFLYRYEKVAFLQIPVAVLEPVPHLIFLVFVVSAFERLSLNWLWAALALSFEIFFPAWLTLAITTKLYEADAPHIWWYATFVAVGLLKVAIALSILLWRINFDARKTVLSENKNDSKICAGEQPNLPTPRFVQSFCIVIAIVFVPTLIFVRFIKFDPLSNSLIVGSLLAVSLSYKVWFEKLEKR